jgi:cysteinyl-tRNA synthetase
VAAAVFEIFEGVLGLDLHDQVAGPPAAALAQAKERDEARARRDWARADEIRAELQADGWIVEDGPEGTAIRPSGTSPDGTEPDGTQPDGTQPDETGE